MEEDTVDEVVIGQFCLRYGCAVDRITVVGENEVQYVAAASWLVYQLK